MTSILQTLAFFVLMLFAAVVCAAAVFVIFVVVCGIAYQVYAYMHKKFARRLYNVIVGSQRLVRCNFTVPPLMGDLGVQFGAWTWEVVSHQVLCCDSTGVQQEWCTSVAATWKKPHKAWKHGGGKGSSGKGRSGRGNSGNSSGRFGNFR